MTQIKDSLEGLRRITDSSVRIDSHHYIVLSQLNLWIETIGKPFARGVLLDYGCGGQPYRTIFADGISQYIGADVATAADTKLDIILIPGHDAPLPDTSVDTILSTQTLEHVYDFQHYLSDCNRLLRQDGRLIITVPMQWRLHEQPFDYWRFTRYGLEKTLSDHGFNVVSMAPCGGVFSLLGQIFLSHLSERGKSKPCLNRLINRLALRLDKRYQDHEDTLLWMCLAQKN